MSHDQKPGKMRVVAASPATPQRRRSDGSPDVAGAAGNAGGSGAAGGASGGALANAAAAATAAEQSGKPVMVLGLIFIAGCAIGGVALPLLGIV